MGVRSSWPNHRLLGRWAAHLLVSLIGVTVAVGGLAGGGARVDAQSAAYGVDVSHYQGTINWSEAAAAGARFAYIKATQGTDLIDPLFNINYPDAYYAGIIRGAYHFAIPSASSGAAQADFFADHGGAWSPDGRTLPGALDIEYNPHGSECYGLSQSEMVSWISSFVNEYYVRTGRWAVIYTIYQWWVTCTGNSSAFAGNDPLWIAYYNGSPGSLPAGWPFYTFWQYSASGSVSGSISTVGDRDRFNGSTADLVNLADNT